MGYHKTTHYIIAALMIAVSYSSSQKKNNVLREASSCKEKSPERGSSVSVWDCYDIRRHCFHYGKAGCSKDLYRGNADHTLFGISCQYWNSKRPSKHNKHHDLPVNYCRNPDGADGPWCYITHSHRTWDYCFIDCAAHECFDSTRGCFHYGKARCQKRYMYNGKRSHTFDGIECQKWSTRKPKNSYLPRNYCSNPDGAKGPWCYATKKIAHENWDYCFQDCAADDCYDNRRKCYHYGKAECNKKYLYNGTRSYTFHGVKCQQWNSKGWQYKHVPENYCRIVWGNEGAPWCYATKNIQGKDWDYCLYDCSADDCYDSNRKCYHYGKAGCTKKYMYNGTRSYTFDGIKCQQWSTKGYNYNNIAENYCRMFWGTEKAPWCYATKKIQGEDWDYCLSDCSGDDCFMYNGQRQCYSREERCQTRYVYNGSRNFNLHRHRCLKWSSARKFKYLPGSFCRNPDKGKAPWCYTEGMKTGEWNYCYDEECDTGTCYDSDSGCFHYERADCKETDAYLGTRDFTISGVKCLNWRPLQHPGTFVYKNYCRITPRAIGPWCMTRKGSDYCFPQCDGGRCYDSSRDCFHYGKPGCSKEYAYIGTRNYSVTGHACIRWFAYKARKAGNLCRNPAGSKKGPYCYLDWKNFEWDYCFQDCNADKCYDKERDCFYGEKPECTKLYSYVGKKKHTIEGTKCHLWSSYNVDLPRSYCRFGSRGFSAPWCYTSREPKVRTLCFSDCLRRNVKNGYSCGMYYTRAQCENKARKCPSFPKTSRYKSYKGKCDLLKSRRHHCICQVHIGH